MNHRSHWRGKLHEIIFDHFTFAGRLFDLALLILIILGVLTVLLDSVRDIHNAYGPYLQAGEWIVTCLFTLEYAARLACAANAWRYATSFFGITHTFTLVRTLRLLRVFRILKLTQFLGEATVLKQALRASLPKITVFLFTVLTVVILVGAMMYQIEGEQNGFTSIPTAMYWAIVTVTTVGYGDISTHGPRTLYRLHPHGVGLWNNRRANGHLLVRIGTHLQQASPRPCPGCALNLHDRDASHCKHCGQVLPPAS